MTEISINSALRAQILDHVVACMPEEACGLIGGIKDVAYEVFPVENVLHSHARFLMNDLKLLEGLSQLEEKEFELIGTFHSHPNGPAWPSLTDIEDLQHLGIVHVIVVPRVATSWIVKESWELFGFLISNENLPMVTPIKII